MLNLDKLLDVSDKLDQAGLSKEADILDQHISIITKTAKAGMHKCGLKEETVEQHLELLEGYKKALEHYKKEYKKISQSNNEIDSPNYGSLKEITQNYAYNLNSVNLHNMYIEDVVTNNPYSIEKDSQMQDFLKNLYGQDYKKFEKEIKRLANVPRSGWVLFCFCTISKELIFNVVDLHDEHIVSCAVPVLALDMWEHAYYHDFGTNKEAYVDWYLSRIDWRNPKKRLKNLMRLK